MHRGSEPGDKFSSRDEKSFCADNICFILKVAKEEFELGRHCCSSVLHSEALAQGSDGRKGSSPEKPAPSAAQISKDRFATGDD